MIDKEETKVETEAPEEGKTVEIEIEEQKAEESPKQEATEEQSQAEEIDNYSKGVQERIKSLPRSIVKRSEIEKKRNVYLKNFLKKTRISRVE